MESKLISVLLCFVLASLISVGGQNVNVDSSIKSNINVKDTKSSEVTTTTALISTKPTTSPRVQIQCLGNDCNNGPLSKIGNAPVAAPKPSLIQMHKTDGDTPVSSDVKVEDVTSVPRKGVDGILVDDGPTVPRKGVTTVHHSQSAKKELKELNAAKGVVASTAATTTTTTTTTSTTTTSTTTTASTADPDEANINRKQIHDLNVATTTLTPKEASPHSKPDVTLDEQDFATNKTSDDQASPIGTSLVVGLVCALILMTVLLFVGLKRIESIRRRREYRRMNDFLIDGMYNDL